MNDAVTTFGYEAIKELARSANTTIPNVLVLARQNDPFFGGAPAQREKAEWFARLWERFGYSTGVHQRRVHYRLVSQEKTELQHDGKPYENTNNCWNYLGEAGKAARYLGLVSPDAFVDRRNPDPHIMVEYEFPPYPNIDFEGDSPEYWRLPGIRTDLALSLNFDIPCPQVYGYHYQASDQPYHLELWIEKSTMDDVLIPVCKRRGINLVTSVGFQSITSAINLLKRVADCGKPVRIFYISDFDPAGDGMPVAASRQIEYWLSQYAPDADILLTPLALTKDQVVERQLPRIPVKQSDRRKANFEGLYGEGAVELDALESLYPGVLAEMVHEAASPYRDPNIRDELLEADQRAEEQVASEWDLATGNLKTELDEIKQEAIAVYQKYQDKLEQLDQQLQVELAPIKERLDAVRQAILMEINGFSPCLPDRPTSLLSPPDESAWLFDSKRTYFTQLKIYRARKDGG